MIPDERLPESLHCSFLRNDYAITHPQVGLRHSQVEVPDVLPPETPYLPYSPLPFVSS